MRILCVHMSCVNMASLEKTNSWREWVRPAGRWDQVELLTVHTRRVRRARRDRDNVELAERFDGRETCLERNIERNLKRTRENSLNLIEVTAHCTLRRVCWEQTKSWQQTVVSVSSRWATTQHTWTVCLYKSTRITRVWVTHNIRPLA